METMKVVTMVELLGALMAVKLEEQRVVSRVEWKAVQTV